jgi:predicted SAM-dependent methyltransferase
MSETSHARARLLPYCNGYGLDLGFGGDKIQPSAIGVDLPIPYTQVGKDPVQLGGDARHLIWFRDEVLDYVYSSHLLEDFPANETRTVLVEWLRVLKVGGSLILYQPDEQVFRAHCKATGQPYNSSHSVPDFSLSWLRDKILATIPGIEIVHSNPLVEAYSFEIVVRKTCSTRG